MVILFILAIGGMFYITEQNLDYNDFVKYMNRTVDYKKEKKPEEAKLRVTKTYGGVFMTGHCVQVDDVDYYKIISEEEENYIHVTCKFGSKCLTTPIKSKRTDFEISYSDSDIIACPIEK